MTTVYDVPVPTETGSICYVEVVHDPGRNTYEVMFSAELLDWSPEALTAAVQMALLDIRGLRR